MTYSKTFSLDASLRIISVYFQLYAIFIVFMGLFVLIYAINGNKVGGIFIVFSGLLQYVAGAGLWKKKEWARVLVIAISSLHIIVGVIDLFIKSEDYILGFIIFTAINIVIILYLLFNKTIRSIFPIGDSRSITIALVTLAIIAQLGIKTGWWFIQKFSP